MKRIGCIAVCLLAGAGALSPGSAAAQNDPDLREIIPYLMLVIDTSGSMERLTSCTCTTPGCTECLPDCSLSNDAGGNPPVDANGHDLKKNRWATTLEALTGTFKDFQCEEIARTAANGMTYDVGYYLPYHQPWDCTGQLPGTPCAYNATGVSTLDQNHNGILDQYASQVQFGLMTFDGFDTYVGASPLVPVSSFDDALSKDVQGLWSYGPIDPASGKQGVTFHYPNCTTDYMIDTGARSPAATEGGLVSLNSCSGPPNSPGCQPWCSQCPGSQASVNQDIQTALLKARPYGGTPIAASLDDLYYHLKHDLTDTFGSCRNRFALLMTDGYPDLDYRDFGCDCQQTQDPLQPHYCGDDPNASIPGAFHCPYPTPEDVASDLILGRDGDPAMIQQLFVVGLAVDDANVLTKLDAIAHAGCPNATGCDTDGDGHEALFANDLNKLVQNLSAVINSLIQPVSRSVPAFASGGDAATSSQVQYQINTGFDVATDPGLPWTGRIERRRFTCSNGALSAGNIDPFAGDLFQDVMNSGSEPQLNTILPPSGFNLDGPLDKGTSTAACGVTGCSLIRLEDVTTYPSFGLTAGDGTGFNQLMDWMYGRNGSVRVGRRLGDIYHSQPAIVGAPLVDSSDEAFNLFRQRVEVATRPLMLYVGSNDGILHAFSVEDYTPQGAAATIYSHYDAGQQVWGFVPPLLLNDIKNNENAHQFTLDGSPVVKNVYFSKAPGADATGQEYHTVLITGMREGGNAYIALDVTNPAAPKFLWQFTDPHMGKTFGQAAIGQATFMDNSSGTNAVKNGAVAILPGGVGAVGNSGVAGDCTDNGVATSVPTDPTDANQAYHSFSEIPDAAGNAPHIPVRAEVRCWQDIGRALYFVDVENGRLLKKIHKDASGKLVFSSPLVSTPALFSGDIGAVASRAFITDADGVIWRVDLSSADQKNTIINAGDQSGDPTIGWVARPFHDIFWDKGPGDGELSYEAPLLSVDDQGQLVVIVGTGDNNNFVKPTVENRVVSLREVIDSSVGVTPDTPQSYKAALNWEYRVKPTGGLVPSELVTGSMGLLDGQLFFGTFIAVSGGDACDLGKGRIHAVDYLARDLNDSNQTTPLTYGPRLLTATELGLDSAGQSVINVDASAALDNFMVMGLGVTERPTCSVFDTNDFSVFGQGVPGMSTLNPPAIYLVAQASGDKGATSLIQKHGGSALGSIELQLQKKATSSRVLSWATTID